mmetsp:Transcript_18777/g.34785  ORF Transcript_18777/g.34785 Transcript_18777/m.34785 type:complete len:326 (+) Transcript_18777:149-1126(+)|eukprot:CAMPEP_0184520958 /NCGR_PEP_ID=MMETSP0198_2-20121128/7453_1 /TAXON_ID=1112570 /ORGANISM="Thraustochytrium sp., Strain LLF1b" /LENGTH=325 /DNA_ID=CAMNT_0026911607 /DNA_START=110 /DNA_END=1087 /DNA_ORIENTATION=+
MHRATISLRALGGSGQVAKVSRGSLSAGRLFAKRTFSTEQVHPTARKYAWISAEAEDLIAKAYARHKALADTGGSFPPSLGKEGLEKIGETFHYPPKTVGDKVAASIVSILEKAMHLFFREKYEHHAVTLETVAAVPGIVAAMHRHLRSLRTMKRDHGWINPLQEEAENERMHLLIWMQHVQPSAIERMFVMLAQGFYVVSYGTLYAISPKTAHRTVGYLEESAHRAYTDYLNAVDAGAIPNTPALTIAKAYYRLPEDAMLRDVILQVRADEAMHRDFNHHLADLHANNQADLHPVTMEEDLAMTVRAREHASNMQDQQQVSNLQ